mmetsp:Transcript_40314/g.93443  ORF Transcript_40314/g.93443 Transcript_40314/m.93443 type:complete len:208 (+) Transcript_40314:483-1106(+)
MGRLALRHVPGGQCRGFNLVAASGRHVPSFLAGSHVVAASRRRESQQGRCVLVHPPPRCSSEQMEVAAPVERRVLRALRSLVHFCLHRGAWIGGSRAAHVHLPDWILRKLAWRRRRDLRCRGLRLWELERHLLLGGQWPYALLPCGRLAALFGGFVQGFWSSWALADDSGGHGDHDHASGLELGCEPRGDHPRLEAGRVGSFPIAQS